MSLNPLDSLLPEPLPSQPIEFRWGTVKSLLPLQVHLDRDDPSVWLECATTIKATVGMRVFVLLFEGRTTIIGASKGADTP